MSRCRVKPVRSLSRPIQLLLWAYVGLNIEAGAVARMIP